MSPMNSSNRGDQVFLTLVAFSPGSEFSQGSMSWIDAYCRQVVDQPLRSTPFKFVSEASLDCMILSILIGRNVPLEVMLRSNSHKRNATVIGSFSKDSAVERAFVGSVSRSCNWTPLLPLHGG